VTATGAHAVATRAGGLGTTHATRPATATASGTAATASTTATAATASTKESLEHHSHLLLQTALACARLNPSNTAGLGSAPPAHSRSAPPDVSLRSPRKGQRGAFPAGGCRNSGRWAGCSWSALELPSAPRSFCNGIRKWACFSFLKSFELPSTGKPEYTDYSRRIRSEEDQASRKQPLA
jgi:hypothetical protein